MFDQIFLSSQMKRSVIISNKDIVYEFPHELPNDFKLQDFKEISGKSENFIEL